MPSLVINFSSKLRTHSRCYQSVRKYVSMVFSDDDKAVMKNDYDEFGLNAYEIWNRHRAKKWHYSSVKRIIKQYQETGTMDQKKDSGRLVTVSTEENQEVSQ